MPHAKVNLLAVLLAGTAAACASGHQRDAAVRTERPDTISFEEIERVHANTAWQAVAILRPQFLKARTHLRPAALVDGMIQPLDVLHEIPRGTIESVRYISPSDAAFRYGGSGSGGLIVVTTRVR